MTFSGTVVTVPNLNTHVRDNTLHLYENKGNVRAVASKSANYTATANDGLILCTGTFTVTLPAAATVGANFALVIKNASTGVITVDGNASETIDGSTTITVPAYDAVTVISDGSNWAAIRAATTTLSKTTSTTTVTATTGDVLSYSVPANTLGTDQILEVEIVGDFLNNGGGSVDLVWTATYGATTIASINSGSAVGPSASRRPVCFRLVLAANNATNAQRVWAHLIYGAAGSDAGAMAAPMGHYTAGHNTCAEDSTASKTLAVSVNTSSGSATFRAFSARVTRI